MIRYLGISIGNQYLDEAAENYLYHGYVPGSFLTSVLENNLLGAVYSADFNNAKNLTVIVKRIGDFFPELSYGSPKNVNDWILDKKSIRSKWNEKARKEFIVDSLKGTVHNEKQNDFPF